jgi:hypothetical protein
VKATGYVEGWRELLDQAASQQQGFAGIVADVAWRKDRLLIETAKLVDRTVPGSDHQGCHAGAEPASNSPNLTGPSISFGSIFPPTRLRGVGPIPSRGKRPRNAKAEVIAMIIGGVPEAQGRAEAHWIACPGTAANDTVVAIALCYPG